MKLIVSDSRSLLDAFTIFQNSMEPSCSIVCKNARTVLGKNPSDAMTKAAEGISYQAGSFSASQLTQFELREFYNPVSNTLTTKVSHKYLSDFKQSNDTRCLAAEIGSHLRRQLGPHPTLPQAIEAYQHWINDHYTYADNNLEQDHSAAGLLQKGTGVCQAIASLTTLVFPWLGFPAFYIVGDSYRTASETAPHAWNILQADGRLIHADFTFGMNITTPTTMTDAEEAAFRFDHIWKQEDVDLGIWWYRSRDKISRSPVQLDLNRKKMKIGSIVVETDRPILQKDEEGCWINLRHLLPLLGGCCELLPQTNQLRICLNFRQVFLSRASSSLRQDGCVRIQSLGPFLKNLARDGDGLRFCLQL